MSVTPRQSGSYKGAGARQRIRLIEKATARCEKGTMLVGLRPALISLQDILNLGMTNDANADFNDQGGFFL